MNLLDLYVAISLDSKGFNSDIDKVEKKTATFGKKIQSLMTGASKKTLSAFGDMSKKMVSMTGDIIKGTAKVSGVAIGAGAAAVVAVSKQAVDAYANYEQLAGGVETLFEGAAPAVIENAQNAFKTAQMSANDYMETVTSFSASLIQSLGGDTEAAAAKADTAIIDMADNANKMGTAIDSIQNAYQGFAKQNYTMLDNLKLGYGGTQAEMERLLADAEAISGVHYELGNFADMTDAIHVIQEKMGIAGASAEEASKTIEGSINKMKASWKNLLTGFGDPDADIGKLTEDVVESAGDVISNVVPTVERILESLTKVITEKGADLIQKFIQLIVDMAPNLIMAALSLVTGLIDAIVATIQDPTTMNMLFEAVSLIAEALLSAMDNIFGSLINIVDEQGSDFIKKIVEFIVAAAPDLILGVATLIATVVEAIASVLGDDNTMTSVFDAITETIQNLLPIIMKALMTFVDLLKIQGPTWVKQILAFIIDMAPTLIVALTELIVGLAEAFVEILKDPEVLMMLLAAVVEIVTLLFLGIVNVLDAVFGDLLDSIFGGLTNGWNAIGEWFAGIPDKIMGFFSGAGTWLLDAGKSIINGLIDGITSGIDWVADKLSFITDMIPEWKGPPKRDGVLLKGSGSLIMQGLMDGIDSETGALQAMLGGITGTIANGIDTDFVPYGDSVGGGLQNSISSLSRSNANGPDTITVQSVLDGRVISESSAKYDRREARAKGV